MSKLKTFILLLFVFILFTGYQLLFANKPPEIQKISWSNPLTVNQATRLEIVLTDKEQDKLYVTLEHNNALFSVQSRTEKSIGNSNKFIFNLLPKVVAKNEQILLHYSDENHVLTKSITIDINGFPPIISQITPNLSLILGELSTLEVDLEHTEYNPENVIVFLETRSNFISVLSSERRVIDNNKLKIHFDILPTNVGNEREIIIHYGVDELLSKRYPVTVDMPLFFNEEASTFVEMVKAPDESIYGSHITLWRGWNNDNTLVTGHAASNICREVSGTLFNYALNSAKIDSNFFLGAGLASLPKDEEKYSIIQKSLDELKPFKKTYDNSSRCKRIWGQYVKCKPDLPFLKSLLIAIKSNIVLNAQDVPNIDKFKALTSTNNLTQTQENFLKYLINKPAQALKLKQKATWKDLYPFIQEFSHLTTLEREEIVNKLDKIISYLESDQLFSIGLNSVQEKSGLLKIIPNPYIKAHKNIQTKIKNWVAVNKAPNTLNLQDTLAIVPNSPKASVVLVPYYNSKTQEEVIFSVPKQKFESSTGSNARDFFNQSVMNEMKGDLRRAAERMEKMYKGFVKNLKDLNKIRTISNQNFSKWLKEEEFYKFNKCDERGECRGIEKILLTYKNYWGDRLNNAEYSRIQAKHYRLAAEQLEQQSTDPKLNSILEYILLDSFLRGRNLSFVDNSLNSPYRKWLKEKRNDVWFSIITQARSQGINIQSMITESTVFQVRNDGNSYTIRPLFVANLQNTIAVKSQENALVYYETPWNNRKLIYLKPQDLNQSVWKKAQNNFSQNHETAGNEGLAILADHYYAQAQADAQSEENSVALTRKALSIAPKYIANKLIQELWDSWNDNWVSSEERLQFNRISLKDANERSRYLSQLRNGNWPFVDYYLMAALKLSKIIVKQEENQEKSNLHTLKIAKQALQALIKNGKQIDKEYMDIGLEKGKFVETSKKFKKFLLWKMNQGFNQIIDICACLSKVSFDIDEGNVTKTQRGIKSCLDDMAQLGNHGLLELFIPKEEIEALNRKTKQLTNKNWNFDALGRFIAKQDIQNVIQALAEPAIRTASGSYNKEKALLNSLVRLEWYSGKYKSAFDLALNEIQRHSSTEKTKQLVKLLQQLEIEVLKALIYSGGQMQMNSAIFEMRASDVIKQSKNIENVSVGISKPNNNQIEEKLTDNSRTTPDEKMIVLGKFEKARIFKECSQCVTTVKVSDKELKEDLDKLKEELFPEAKWEEEGSFEDGTFKIKLTNDHDNKIGNAIYQTLQAIDLEGNNSTLTLMEINNNVYARIKIGDQNSEFKKIDSYLLKEKLEGILEKCSYYLWKQFFINKGNNPQAVYEFINSYPKLLGRISKPKIGDNEVIAVIDRGLMPINYNQVFPNNHVFTIGSSDMETAKENMAKSLELLNSNITLESEQILVGLPQNKTEFDKLKEKDPTIGDWEDSREKLGWRELGEKFYKNFSDKRRHEEVKSIWKKLLSKLFNKNDEHIEKPSSSSTIKDALQNKLKKEQLVILLAHHKNGELYFFNDKGESETLSGTDIEDLKESIGNNKPAVILLSCSTGGISSPFVNNDSITQAFLKIGASMVIAPNKRISAMVAVDFLINFTNQSENSLKRSLKETLDFLINLILKNQSKNSLKRPLKELEKLFPEIRILPPYVDLEIRGKNYA